MEWSLARIACFIAHAVVHGPSKFGAAECVSSFCVVGGDPQDYTFAGEHTQLIAGDKNIFREYVTVSRGTKRAAASRAWATTIFCWRTSHIGHDCQIGSNNLFVNAATLAGHVTIEDFATDRRTVAGPSILPRGTLCVCGRFHGDHAGRSAVFAHRHRTRDQIFRREFHRSGTPGFFGRAA